MFDGNAPIIYPSYTSDFVIKQGEDATDKLIANTPLKIGVGSGGQRPANGQIYPRGDR
jgi:hypothetical protein